MSRRDLADLTMLADGSLPAARRAEVEARVTATRDGRALLENERRAVEALRGAATTMAPDALRERLATDRAKAASGPRPLRSLRPAPRWGRAVLGGALVGAVAIVLALTLSGHTTAAPSVTQAASLALRGPSLPPPPAQGAHPGTLARDVDEVYFPARLGNGSKATGERVDQLDGRVARTIFYTTPTGRQIAYTIVAGPALAEPSHGTPTSLHHTQLRSIALGGRIVVTWRRGGHTCILSAARVPDQQLLDLAAWKASV